MLAGVPGDDRPVGDEEFERRVAGLYLRAEGVRILDVWKGEPDEDGKPRPAAGRYMLLTKGHFITPKTIPVRDGNGNVSTPSYTLYNSTIVVEVKGETIQPLRAESNRAP
jgi:hypothetical protein